MGKNKRMALLAVLLLLPIAGVALVVPATSQNSICPTAPPGTSTNQCASTAFVTAAVAVVQANISSGVGAAFNKGGVAQTGIAHQAYTQVTWSATDWNNTGNTLTSSTWTASATGKVHLDYQLWITANATSTGSPTYLAKGILNGICNVSGTDMRAVIGTQINGWAGAAGEAIITGGYDWQVKSGDVMQLCIYATSQDAMADIQIDGNAAHTFWNVHYVR